MTTITRNLTAVLVLMLGLGAAVANATPIAADAAGAQFIYPFDAAPGGITPDTAPNGLDAELLGGAAIVEGGVFGSALSLTAAGDIASMNNTTTSATGRRTVLDGATAITIKGWLYPTSRTPSVEWGFLHWVNKEGEWSASPEPSPPAPLMDIYFFMKAEDNNNKQDHRFRVPIPLNEWTHLAIVDTTATFDAKVYINGVEQTGEGQVNYSDQDELPGGIRFGNDTANVGGNSPNHPGQWFGLMDDLGVFDVALSAAEIAESAFIPPTCVSCTDFTDAILDELCNGAPLPTSAQELKTLIEATIAATIVASGGICAGDDSGASTETECEEYLRSVLLTEQVCAILNGLLD